MVVSIFPIEEGVGTGPETRPDGVCQIRHPLLLVTGIRVGDFSYSIW